MTSRYSLAEPLRAEHDIEGFDCGSAAQTDWLINQALQAQRGNSSRVFVVRRLSDDKVVAYYALITGSVSREEASDRVLKGAGRYEAIPVMTLARFGVDLSEQGQGLGRSLLQDALLRVNRVADDVGFRALLIHAETEDAKAFYLHLADLDESPVDPLQLSLLLKDFRASLPPDLA